MRLHCTFWIVMALLVVWQGRGAEPGKTKPRAEEPSRKGEPSTRTVLPNGVTVLIYPLPGAERLVVESFYRVGFMQEPAKLTQIAHLVEHLAVQCAIEGYPAGAAFSELNRAGMANAETLPTFTHFDYLVPTNALDAVLQIEAGRLSTLQMDAAIVRQEAPKCYQEANFVEQNPRSGALKHAFMAFNQAWAHGATTVRVKSGLEDIPLNRLQEFHQRYFQPNNLVLVLFGPFQTSQALALAKKHFGNLVNKTATPSSPPKWGDLAETAVQWDLQTRGFCLAFPPPADPRERLLLTLWGNLQLGKLAADPDLQLSSDVTFCSNQTWPIGELPLFFYGVPKTNESLLHFQKVLKARVQFLGSRKVEQGDIAQLKVMLQGLSQTSVPTWAMIRQQATVLGQQIGQPTSQAAGLVMGNLAVQYGMRELLLGSFDSKAIAAVEKQLTPEWLEALIARTMSADKMISTILVPSTL